MSAVSATDYTQVGVKVGETADYTYSTTTANGTGTGRFHIEILQINGTDVTISEQELRPNNSEGPAVTYTDNVSSIANQQFFSPYVSTYTYSQNNSPVKTGETYPAYLVVANLNQGDNLFSDISPGFTWSPIKTITMLVAGQTRTVNQATYTGFHSARFLEVGENYSYSNEAYFDKITGLLVESNITTAWGFYPNMTKISLIAMLTSTSAFTSPIAVPLITTAVTAIVAVTIIAATITSHKKLKTTTN
jgi:hypothetical protein